MKKLQLFPIIVFSILLFSCEKDPKLVLSLEKVSGFVQKGPYLNGTSITISELSSDLISTGKNFSSQILDNKGSFEVRNVELSSQFVELKADGFYFNEITNSNSSAQLTLYALSDLSNRTSLNVNVLSNLEKNRVEYLILNNGLNFSNAKKQAQSEILKIFEISKTNMNVSELLDISQSGDENAMLLAASVILQGYMNVSDFSEFLANISTDICQDGVLTSPLLGSTLINNAKNIKTVQIRKNLENRYTALGLSVTFPDFEKYVVQFIDSTEFEYTGGIKYPESGKYGLNILDKGITEYTSGSYSMKAIVPEGTSLLVKIKGMYHWYFPAFQDNTGWDVSGWLYDNSRFFTSIRSGEIDFNMWLEYIPNDPSMNYTNKVDVLVYEKDTLMPTWTKVIILK